MGEIDARQEDPVTSPKRGEAVFLANQIGNPRSSILLLNQMKSVPTTLTTGPARSFSSWEFAPETGRIRLQ